MSAIRVQVLGWPATLADLERLCRVARERHLTGEARVQTNTTQSVVITEDADDEEGAP